MTKAPPVLTHFRAELQANGLVHLIFDCPGKSINVFSNVAIHELGAFAEWLHYREVKGVLVRSAKDTGFCAGADLSELGAAYDMIIGAPPADRFDIAFNHFFPLGHAIRRLETCGKPVAAAIHGVALGGGCELALGCHYRVATDAPKTLLGLPECAVGLLPGAGGTQRMPRLVGPELGLEVLLLGRNLQGEDAVNAGLVDRLVEPGDEIDAAEEWLLSEGAQATQPWDMVGATSFAHSSIAPVIEAHRARELSRMLGHEPAPLAILDCVEIGLIQPMDGAIRSEMSVFAALIQRPEPRNMIRTMFLGKQAWDKAERASAVPDEVEAAANSIAEATRIALAACPDLWRAGFGIYPTGARPSQLRIGADYWFRSDPVVNASVLSLALQVRSIVEDLGPASLLQLDHICCRSGTLPAYIGGASGLAALAG